MVFMNGTITTFCSTVYCPQNYCNEYYCESLELVIQASWLSCVKVTALLLRDFCLIEKISKQMILKPEVPTPVLLPCWQDHFWGHQMVVEKIR